MDDSKKAAKAFVDKYFPEKQPTPKLNNILDDLFPPPEASRKKEFVGQSSTYQSTTADGNSHGSPSKSQSTPQKCSNGVVPCEVSDPCLMSSSVDYSCQDSYHPCPPAIQQPGNFYRDEDRKDGYDYKDLENSRGEWWQGSFYY